MAVGVCLAGPAVHVFQQVCECVVVGVVLCLRRLMRIGDSAMSVVSDGSQLALLIVFCRDFNQPVAQLAVSGSLCVHTRGIAGPFDGLRCVVVPLHCRCCHRW